MALQGWCGGPHATTFTENRGQWPAQVLYRALIPGGGLFVERNTLTYTLQRGGPAHPHVPDGSTPEPWRGHAYQVVFEGAAQAAGEGMAPLPYYENHFHGSDPTHWGTHCNVFGAVRATALYPGIDLLVDGHAGVKYDLLVAPGADPGLIAMRFVGTDGLTLRDGRLLVHTSVGDVIEEAPVAFQETATGRRPVPCRYRLEGDRLTFELPEGHDAALPLVIDPVLTFSTYSGSSGDNFGFTASYDAAGHLYGGGIVFDVGYPTTLGVLDPSFNGARIDIGLTKFTPDGTALVWSTYLGGSGNESPHSLVVNSNEELYMLGSTGSADFPVTSGAFDTSFNGGTNIHQPNPLGTSGWVGYHDGYGYGHPNGTDIVVAHLSADATSLIACTYVGGTGNDGLNNVQTLAHNYGDAFRGEIALDAQERPVVATSTCSTDIPVSSAAPQPTYGGGEQDAYFFRMDPLLSTLKATFYGGSGTDSGYGVQFDSSGGIFLSGGTTSTDLPMAGSPLHGSAQGGSDGFLIQLSPNGSTLVASTYIGTSANDQCYFVQLDPANNVFVIGQTRGAYPITPGKYAVPNSTQFIQKLDHSLSTSLWSTMIGSGHGDEDIAPSAFLVSDCGQIYFSGWAGSVNSHVGLPNSTTNGLPVTPDAFQPTTDGSDFYLMVLDPEAAALRYATFFGGSTSQEHVDGGTSRFDKNGTVYQAVCAGCGGHDDFPSTPGAWSPTNGSTKCNLGVFKFSLAQAHAQVAIDGPDQVCVPTAVPFNNLSSGGNLYTWTFGDGPSTSDLFEPTHTYDAAGDYTITLILDDTTGCLLGDTTSITLHAFAPHDATAELVDPVCPGHTAHLQAHGASSYAWSPALLLDAPTSASPTTVALLQDTAFVLVATDACGNDTVQVPVALVVLTGGASPDTTVCLGDAVPISAEGGASYAWSPGTSLSADDVQAPLAGPDTTTAYVVHITTTDGCVSVDTVVVRVESTPPVPVIDDVAVCAGDSVHLNVAGGDRHRWWPDPLIAQLERTDPPVSPDSSRWFKVAVINACGTVLDSIHVDVQRVLALAWPDTIVCPGEPLWLHASGGTSYAWSPSGGSTADLLVVPFAQTRYQVIAHNALSCADTAFAEVEVFPIVPVQATGGRTIDFGDSTRLQAFGDGLLQWTPGVSLDCDTCAAPWAAPFTSTAYTVQLTDTNGCRTTAEVIVIVDGSLFVPNTFTPNGDGVNDLFYALATEVRTFHLYIFDRWGQQVYDADALDKPWNGTYHGVPSPIDTYVWRVDMTELSGEHYIRYGHVNLLR